MTEWALVTGSSRGIGRAIALRLAHDGFDIALHCRNGREAAEAVAREIAAMGRSARVLQFDVTERDAAAKILLADVEAHGCYYGVVCNAGIARDKSFPGMSGADWDDVVHTNLNAFFNVLQPLIDADGAPAPARPDRHDLVGLRHQWEPRPGELQRGEGRHHRRDIGARAGTRVSARSR